MARMDPPQAATMATMGSASTPMADICFIALRQRPRLPTKGTWRGNAPSADQNWFVKAANICKLVDYAAANGFENTHGLAVSWISKT